MHVIVHLLLVCGLGLLAASPVIAQERPPPQATPSTDTVAIPVRPPPAPAPAPKAPAADLLERWKLGAELSFTDQSGNKVLRLLTSGLSFSHRDREAFELDGSLHSRYGKSEGEVVSRNVYGTLSFGLRPENALTPFANASAERDPFKRLDLRFQGGAGAKWAPFRGRKSGQASLSLTLQYSFEDLRPQEGEAEPDNRHLARWSLQARGSRQIREGITASHQSHFQPAWSELADYLLRSQTGLKILLTERLALSVEYQLNRTGRPPEGVEPDDRLFKTGLIIDF